VRLPLVGIEQELAAVLGLSAVRRRCPLSEELERLSQGTARSRNSLWMTLFGWANPFAKFRGLLRLSP